MLIYPRHAGDSRRPWLGVVKKRSGSANEGLRGEIWGCGKGDEGGKGGGGRGGDPATAPLLMLLLYKGEGKRGSGRSDISIFSTVLVVAAAAAVVVVVVVCFVLLPPPCLSDRGIEEGRHPSRGGI